jgi:predicted DNA-binding ribbon-helix-helix protein
LETPIVKRSIVVGGHKTSVSLEDPFWESMKEIAGLKDLTVSEVISQINADREHSNLSSAIRLFVLDHYRSRVAIRGAGTAKAAVGALV